MKISNYDQFEYDYSTYWKNRNYEHFAEVMSLSKLFKGLKGKWFLDVGGSYGRHLPSYTSNYSNPIILDYSLNTLINNKERIRSKYPQTELVAANVYHLPFRSNTFDGAMMIRVLHHIQEPESYLKEISTVLKSKSIYIQEFANKIHIKARIKHLLKGDFKFFTVEPYQQPSHGNKEGSKGEESVFLNFHPKSINQVLRKFGFNKITQVNTSFLRLPAFKKILPFKLHILFEKILQKLLSWTNLAPSIFYKLTLIKKLARETSYDNLEEILICPKCKGELNFKKEECICKECKHRYEKVVGIWDFRIQ